MRPIVCAHPCSAFVVGLTLFSSFVFASAATAAPPGEVTSCGTVITQPGVYHLKTDLTCTSAVTAITIAASDVTLHLNNHTLSGAGTSLVAIRAGSTAPGPTLYPNITIQGGAIVNFQFGIVLARVADSKLTNVDVHNSVPTAAGNAITLQRTFNTRVVNCNASGSSFDGINILGGGGNTLISNTANNNAQVGIVAQAQSGAELSHDNVIRANTTVNNGFSGIKIFIANTGNLVQANYAAGHPDNDLYDLNPACDSNTSKANQFGTANQVCIQ